jgi:hypothetical protein
MILTKSLTKLDYRQAFELDSEQNIVTDAACAARSTYPSIRAPGRLYLFDDYLIFKVDANAAERMDDQTKRTISTAPGSKTAQSPAANEDESVLYDGSEASFAVDESYINSSTVVGMNE